MKWFVCLLVLACAAASLATDVTALPFNTWQKVNFTVDMAGHSGSWTWLAGYSSATYDKDRKQMLLADGYVDGERRTSIYTDCIYSFDLEQNKMIYRKAYNWTVNQGTTGGYTTDPLPENATDSTPPPRHICNGFQYVSEKNALYMMQGPNQTLVGADAIQALQDLWIYSFATGKWRQVHFPAANAYEGHLRYVSGSGKLYFFSGGGCSATTTFWEFDLEAETWTLKSSPEICVFWSESMTDPQRRKIVIWSGSYGTYSTYFYAYHPAAGRLDTILPSNSGPNPVSNSPIRYINKYDVYLVNGGEEASAYSHDVWIFDPRDNSWEKGAGSIPCNSEYTENTVYDSRHEVILTYTRPHCGSWADNSEVWAYRYKRSGAPEAAFTASAVSGTAPLQIALDASPSTDDGTIALYEWDYDYAYEGFTPADSGVTKTHAFAQDGIYIIACRVTDNQNKSTIVTKEITVGNTSGITGAVRSASDMLEIYPNPFNSGATARIAFPGPGSSEVSIFNLQGRKIKTLAGTAWDGRDADNAAVPSGIYMVRVTGSRGVFEKRVAFIR